MIIFLYNIYYIYYIFTNIYKVYQSNDYCSTNYNLFFFLTPYNRNSLRIHDVSNNYFLFRPY